MRKQQAYHYKQNGYILRHTWHHFKRVKAKCNKQKKHIYQQVNTDMNKERQTHKTTH